MIKLEKAWIIMYKVQGHVNFEYFNDRESFKERLKELSKIAEDICCFVPAVTYFPYHAKRLNEEDE